MVSRSGGRPKWHYAARVDWCTSRTCRGGFSVIDGFGPMVKRFLYFRKQQLFDCWIRLGKSGPVEIAEIGEMIGFVHSALSNRVCPLIFRQQCEAARLCSSSRGAPGLSALKALSILLPRQSLPNSLFQFYYRLSHERSNRVFTVWMPEHEYPASMKNTIARDQRLALHLKCTGVWHAHHHA